MFSQPQKVCLICPKRYSCYASALSLGSYSKSGHMLAAVRHPRLMGICKVFGGLEKENNLSLNSP
jgi:hypothetical protein